MKFPAPDSFHRHATCPAHAPPLTETERRVVHLGRTDADRGDRGEDRFPRLRAALATLTGNRPVQPLANARLELLRTFASATRRGAPTASDLASQLREQGFSADAIGTATALARR